MYLIKTAQFVKSSNRAIDCPLPNYPEYAFIGRSNVGKSSLLNMLTQHGKLAMVSSKPGKTKLINHFLINDLFYLVDLPGYGYAKSSKTEKAEWGKMTREYLTTRTNLMNIFVLIDSRLEPQKIDLEFCNWLGEEGIPFCIVYTKTDKQNPTQTAQNIKKIEASLLEWWETLPPTFSTSAEKKWGREEIMAYISKTNGLFKGIPKS